MAESVRYILEHNNRQRKINRLMEATGNGRKTEAIDTAIEFYLEMGAVDVNQRVGSFVDLMEAAQERGSLTAPEIAAILDSPQLPLDASTSYSIGD